MGVFAVTGGTGFLGEHLVHQLAADGHQVRVISRCAAHAVDSWAHIAPASMAHPPSHPAMQSCAVG